MSQFYPNASTLYLAGLVQADLAASKLRLFQEGFVPSIATSRAELIAAEADYTGYTAGGETIAAWLAPLLNPIGGASIDMPTIQFDAASPYTVANVVAGWWIETAGGVVIAVGTFTTPISIGAVGQGFPMTVTLVFPNGI